MENVVKDLIPLQEAQTLLGVSHQKMTNLVKEGLLKIYRDPLDKRKKLVRRAELARLEPKQEAA